MDFLRAFTYPFEDPQWPKKIIVGGVITAIPIIEWAATGYEVEVVENLVRGTSLPLPEWKDIGGKLVHGFKYTLARAVYYVPQFLLFIVGFVFAGFWFGFTAQSGDPRLNELMGWVSGTGFTVTICLGLLYGVFLAYLYLMLPAVIIRYVKTHSILACLNIFTISRYILGNLSEYILAWVGVIIANVVLVAAIGAVAGFLGWIPGLGWLAVWLILGYARFSMKLIWANYMAQIELDSKTPQVIPATSPTAAG